MKTKKAVSYRSLVRRWLTGLGFVLLIFISSTAKAHPLDEFYQVTFVTVAPNRISLIVELYPGILVAPQILMLIDTNRDDLISQAEGQAYANLFLKDLRLEIDDISTPLAVTKFEFDSPIDLRGGIGVIRFNIQADLPPDHRGEHQFFYQNDHQPDMSVYVVNAISSDTTWVQIQHQEPDVFQRSLHLNYTISPDAPVDSRDEQALAEIEIPGGVSPIQKELTAYLYDPNLSPFFIVAVFGLSIFLGGLHALAPGHGKTLVAAYLVGSQGTVRDAIFLGGVVTFTHTAAVIGIGLLALLASQFILPNLLVPALEVLAGLLVVYLGVQLLWSRWRAYQQGEDHHSHPHAHDHPHNQDHHHHHRHSHPIPETVKLSDLLTLGISGGLVPCPEALGVMLIAIGLNRILLGLGMVVAFSFGLAAVLIILGILLVRMRGLLDQLDHLGGHWQALLPLLSASIVTLLGIGIVIKGLMAYLIG